MIYNNGINKNRMNIKNLKKILYLKIFCILKKLMNLLKQKKI